MPVIAAVRMSYVAEVMTPSQWGAELNRYPIFSEGAGAKHEDSLPLRDNRSRLINAYVCPGIIGHLSNDDGHFRQRPN